MSYQGFEPYQITTKIQKPSVEETILDGTGQYEIDATLYSYVILNVEGDTDFTVNFNDNDTSYHAEVIVQFNSAGSHSIGFGDSNQVIYWIGGTEPTLTTGIDIIRFYRNINNEIFGEVIGLDFGA